MFFARTAPGEGRGSLAEAESIETADFASAAGKVASVLSEVRRTGKFTIRVRCERCGAFRSAEQPCRSPRCSQRRQPDNPFTYAIRAGRLVCLDAAGNPQPFLPRKGCDARQVQALVELSDLAKAVLRADDQAAFEAAKAALRARYDSYVEAYGPVLSDKCFKALRNQPALANLLALEIHDPRADSLRPGDIFNLQWREKAAGEEISLWDAAVTSYNELGRIDPGRVAALMGIEPAEAEERLQEDGLIEVQGEAIRPVMFEREIPAAPPVAFEDIAMRLEMKWIPRGYLSDFMLEVIFPDKQGYGYNKLSRDDIVFKNNVPFVGEKLKRVWDAPGNIQLYGLPEMPAVEIITRMCRGGAVTVYKADENGKRVLDKEKTYLAREMRAKIQAAFRDYLEKNPYIKKSIADTYNQVYNSYTMPEFDVENFAPQGLPDYFEPLHDHQKRAILRGRNGEGLLIAHGVGKGKTRSLMGIAMEQKRLGAAEKPMIVVLDHMLYSNAQEMMRMYPGANVRLVANEQMNAENRAQTLEQMRSGQYDAIIITHTAFESIQNTPEMGDAVIEDELRALRAVDTSISGDNQFYFVKRRIEALEKQLARRRKGRAEGDKKGKKNGKADRVEADAITWEMLGVDSLLIDEADSYKGIPIESGYARGGDIPGLNINPSERAIKVFERVRWLQRERGGYGRGVVMATGTPISNTLAETYNYLRMFRQEELYRRNIFTFDDWLAQFGEVTNTVELDPLGQSYRVVPRVARFDNLPELNGLLAGFVDLAMERSDSDDVPKIKGGGYRPLIAPKTERFGQYIQSLLERGRRLGDVEATEDNWLKITTQARQASVDLRTVMPDAPDDPNSKLNRMIQDALETYRAGTNIRLPGVAEPVNRTAMIFCDTNRTQTGFSIYDEIRRKLIAGGVPEGEIAIMQEATSPEEKRAVQEAMNAGKVRFLIGSTMSLGAGTNAQRLLGTIYNLDTPWRPRDIEQRLGRGLRQGNLNPEVDIVQCITESSPDAYVWQTVERKQQSISQVFGENRSQREAADVDAVTLGFSELMAISSDDPILMKRVATEKRLAQLTAERQARQAQMINFNADLAQTSQSLNAARSRLNRIAVTSAIIREAQALAGGDGPFFQPVTAAEDFPRWLKEQSFSGGVEIGRYAGRFPVRLEAKEGGFEITIPTGYRQAASLSLPEGKDPRQMRGFANWVSNQIYQYSQEAGQLKESITGLEGRLQQVQAEKGALDSRLQILESEYRSAKDSLDAIRAELAGRAANAGASEQLLVSEFDRE